MVKSSILAGFLVLLGTAMPAFSARTILFYEDECCRPITEGEFAILYVQGLKLPEPAQGWTVQTAAAALSQLGHQPEGGWVLSRYLSEAVMARLLRDSPFYRRPFSDDKFQKSDTLVLISKARSVFPGDDPITQGDFAVLLVQALRLPAPGRGWSADSAVEALSRQTPAIGPARGWNPRAELREAEMLQILARTAFRASPVEPTMEVSPLHAYSLLFGKFEIATEGHLGLFVVSSLNVPPPPGGWTRSKALDYLRREFGVESGYGWNANAPLCAETFGNALAQIAAKVHAKSGGSSPRRSAGPGWRVPRGGPDVAPLAEAEAVDFDPQASAGPPPAQNRLGPAFVNDLRSRGLIPADKCAIVPLRLQIWETRSIPEPPSPYVPPGR